MPLFPQISSDRTGPEATAKPVEQIGDRTPAADPTDKRHISRYWAPLSQAADTFAMTADGFRRQIRPLLSEQDVRTAGQGRGRKTYVYLRGAVQAFADKEAQRQVRAVAGPDAELLVGGDSPALERYRLAKAQLTEIDLDQRRRNVITMEAAKRLFGTVAAHLRRGLDTLQRQFGRDAYTVMKDCLEDARRDFEHGARKTTDQQKDTNK